MVRDKFLILSDVTLYSLDGRRGNSLVTATMPEISIDIGTRLSEYTLQPHPTELSSKDLRARVHRLQDQVASQPFPQPRTLKLLHRDWTEYYFKFAIPFACIALVLVAVPVSLRGPRDERNLGIIMTFMLVMSYYIVFFSCRTLGSRGLTLAQDAMVFGKVLFLKGTNMFPPMFAGWLPSFVFLAAAGVLFWRARK
jgi:lipopolysaccharide export LptBFGC system permease protein LptF